MNIENIKNYFSKILEGDISKKEKIFITASLGWIIFIGYLTWWNGLRAPSLDKSFRWDEWFWFGIVPALSPYIFLYMEKKRHRRSVKQQFLSTYLPIMILNSYRFN